MAFSVAARVGMKRHQRGPPNGGLRRSETMYSEAEFNSEEFSAKDTRLPEIFEEGMGGTTSACPGSPKRRFYRDNPSNLSSIDDGEPGGNLASPQTSNRSKEGVGGTTSACPGSPKRRFYRDNPSNLSSIDDGEPGGNLASPQTSNRSKFSDGASRKQSVSHEEWQRFMNARGMGDERDLLGPNILNSRTFQLAVGALVLLNAIFIGVDTDVNRPDIDPPGEPVRITLAVLDNLFCVVWVAEMCLRMYYLRCRYFKDYFNLLDFALVCLGVFQTWIYPLLGSTGLKSHGLKSLMMILRILKLTRLIKIMKMFDRMWMIVQGFSRALQTLGWVILMLFGVIYAGAVFMTIIVGYECEGDYITWELCSDHFSTVSRSMFTLFQIMTFESWSTVIARPVLTQKVWLVTFFLTYLMLTSFGLLNVIVGVVVESTLESADEARRQEQLSQERKMRHELQALRALFEEADVDGGGLVDREEFVEIMSKPVVQRKMKDLALPFEFPSKLFDYIDSDESGAITLDEFCNGAMRLKQEPTGSEMQQMLMQVSVMSRKLQDLEKLTKELAVDAGVLDDDRTSGVYTSKSVPSPRVKPRSPNGHGVSPRRGMRQQAADFCMVSEGSASMNGGSTEGNAQEPVVSEEGPPLRTEESVHVHCNSVVEPEEADTPSGDGPRMLLPQSPLDSSKSKRSRGDEIAVPPLSPGRLQRGPPPLRLPELATDHGALMRAASSTSTYPMSKPRTQASRLEAMEAGMELILNKLVGLENVLVGVQFGNARSSRTDPIPVGTSICSAAV
mmetsp:Transcript_3276/g.8624  ORF Transcript_3276/g.8624 Transcript_3276/m.8624 type:complete len:787 (+) Transcript_3276:136-2496(+)